MSATVGNFARPAYACAMPALRAIRFILVCVLLGGAAVAAVGAVIGATASEARAQLVMEDPAKLINKDLKRPISWFMSVRSVGWRRHELRDDVIYATGALDIGYYKKGILPGLDNTVFSAYVGTLIDLEYVADEVDINGDIIGKDETRRVLTYKKKLRGGIAFLNSADVIEYRPGSVDDPDGDNYTQLPKARGYIDDVFRNNTLDLHVNRFHDPFTLGTGAVFNGFQHWVRESDLDRAPRASYLRWNQAHLIKVFALDLPEIDPGTLHHMTALYVKLAPAKVAAILGLDLFPAWHAWELSYIEARVRGNTNPDASRYTLRTVGIENVILFRHPTVNIAYDETQLTYVDLSGANGNFSGSERVLRVQTTLYSWGNASGPIRYVDADGNEIEAPEGKPRETVSPFWSIEYQLRNQSSNFVHGFFDSTWFEQRDSFYSSAGTPISKIAFLRDFVSRELGAQQIALYFTDKREGFDDRVRVEHFKFAVAEEFRLTDIARGIDRRISSTTIELDIRLPDPVPDQRVLGVKWYSIARKWRFQARYKAYNSSGLDGFLGDDIEIKLKMLIDQWETVDQKGKTVWRLPIVLELAWDIVNEVDPVSGKNVRSRDFSLRMTTSF
jgi:hypothetical protein